MRPSYLWAVLLVASAASPVVGAKGAEIWQFDVLYQGVFSAGQPIAIADVALSSKTLPGDPWTLSEIAISSAGHAFTESVYPFRYRVRSLHNAALGSLAFARCIRARKSTQEVWLLDHDRGRSLRFRKQGKGGALPEAIAQKLAPGVAFRFQREGAALQAAPLFDQLGLFQRVRTLPYRPGESFRLAATDGKKLLNYRVSVVARAQLPVGDRTWATWKLRIEGHYANGKTAHPPIFLWLEDSASRIPIRAETRQPIGTFVLRLASVVGELFGHFGVSRGLSDFPPSGGKSADEVPLS